MADERAERLKNLSPAKRALLLRALREAAPGTADADVIPRRPDQAHPFLSYAQQRLWFLDQLNPGSDFYNMPMAVRLTGPLDVDALEKSIGAIVQRHEALRTTFRLTETGPVQVIAGTLRVPLPSVDLRSRPTEEREREARRMLEAESRRPFDLERGPLVRALLMRAADDEHVLLLTVHHIVGDGWSAGVFLREVSALYAAFVLGRPSPLAELPIQYADFAHWQRQWLGGERLESELSYWKRQLADQEPLRLPSDRPRPATPAYRGAVHASVLPRSLTASLQDLSRRHGCTLYMTLLAAFKALLARWSGQDDVGVGSPVANRTRPELEALIGFFANTVVLRTDLSGDPTFVELLTRVSATTLGAYANQDVPFEIVVEALQPERSLGENPLFQVVCVLQNAPLPPLQLPGLKASLIEGAGQTARFDLTLAMVEIAGEIRASWEYSTELYEPRTIERIARDYETLLHAVVARPETRLASLPALTSTPAVGRRRIASIADRAVDLDRLGADLQHEAAIDECVVLARRAGDQPPWLVAYVVCPGGFSPDRLRETMASDVAPSVLDRLVFVPVAAIPRTATGRVDETALSRLEIIDDELVARWEQALRSLPGIGQVVVLSQEATPSLPPLHLSEILPAAAEREASRIDQASADPGQATRTEPAGSPRIPAISDGGTIHLEADAPGVLPEMLSRAARLTPERGLVAIQADGSTIASSYAELLQEAERILGGLRQLGLKPEDKVIFQLRRNQDFLAAFWACQLGGFIPVPVSIPSTYEQPNGGLGALEHAWNMLGGPIVLSNGAAVAAIRVWAERTELAGFRVGSVDELRAAEPETSWHGAQPDDVALILLTSGSTGLPKGVRLSHRNLLCRSASTRQLNRFTEHEVTLNWLPLDHVGGIVYFHLRDVYVGCRQIHAPTEAFLQEPLRWLDWIDRYRVTTTWAPNFAYGLVNECADEVGRRRWDLSSVRFMLNGGEAVVAKTARRFLQLLAPHGLAPTVMHPAWGMSETSSGVTYSYRFGLETTTDDMPYVEVGGPIPGVSFRIVDDNDQVVDMGTTGRLQVKGATITGGYYNNEEANRESFTGDGWFKTGDLGLLDGGRLTITGREKDIIIVGGSNYACHEIESVVEEVDGVAVSFTAACAVRTPSHDTDQLAIFFSPTRLAERPPLTLIDQIREHVVRTLRVRPDYLVPVARDVVPKTAIGKIQRAQLRRRFESGDFRDVLKQIDLERGNANTLPDWFYRRVWRRQEAPATPASDRKGQLLIFTDRQGPAAAVSAALERTNPGAVRVEASDEFRRLDQLHYRIDPREPAHYHRLLACLAEDALAGDEVVHLWTYGGSRNERLTASALERAQDLGVLSLLSLVQALAQRYEGRRSIGLLTVSSDLQAVVTSDRTACEGSSVLGLLRTVAHELPWLDARHVDLAAGPAEDAARWICRELTLPRGETEVAYREGRRFVPRLEKLDWRSRQPRPLPLKTGGTYLVTGGLGGVGAEIVRYLLQHHRAHVLVIGRTALPERSTWPALLGRGDGLARHLETLAALERLGGELAYETLDVADADALATAVERWTSRWRSDLDGVLHLAGILNERLLLDETRTTFAATLRPKVLGACALQQLLKDRPECLLVAFGSLNGIFGGATMGSYAAANSFLDSFVQWRSQATPGSSYCFNWPVWEQIGISRDYRDGELRAAKGYHSITPERGLPSLLAGLCQERPNLLIGLDGTNAHVRRYVATDTGRRQRLVAYFTLEDGAAAAGLADLAMHDRLGTPAPCSFEQLPQMPTTPWGEIDREQLEALGRGARRGRAEHVPPRSEIERRIAQIWQEVLRVPRVGVHDNFFELGGDSILAIMAISRANLAGLRFQPAQLFQYQTVAGLASVCEVGGAIQTDQGPVTGDVPLTPIQHWFFEQDLPDKHHFNMAVMLSVSAGIDASLLEAALERVIWHHDALRMRYEEREGVWRQWDAPPREGEAARVLARRSLVDVPPERRTAAIEAAAEEFQASLNLAEGPALRVAHFDLGPEAPGRLLIVIHHLVMDGVSWRVLLEDLLSAYEQLSQSRQPVLPPRTTSFQAWAHKLQEHASSEAVRNEAAYWLALGGSAPTALPADHRLGPNTVASMRAVSVWLTADETRAILQEVPAVYHTQINDVLLTALAETLARWRGQGSLLVDLEGHGREDVVSGVDVSRTVGWFTALFPVRLDLPPSRSPGDRLKAIKEQLRGVPNRGIGYGLLRYLSEDSAIREGLARLPQPEVSFNYLGQVDQTPADETPLGAAMAPESIGSVFSPRGLRRHLLDVVGIVVEGRLRLDWAYSDAAYRQDTVEGLAARFVDGLREIIAHCRTPEAGGYTPSDFPLAGLNQDELDTLLTQVEFEGNEPA